MVSNMTQTESTNINAAEETNTIRSTRRENAGFFNTKIGVLSCQ